MNLLGAMLLRIGWTDDLTALSEPCLVVRHQGSQTDLPLEGGGARAVTYLKAAHTPLPPCLEN
jgi:hypothetical protein